MADVTVKQFADVVGVSIDRLKNQLEEAGLAEKQSDDVISDAEKSQLLSYLRKMHGKESEAAEPSKVTLKRKTVSELKVPAERGRNRLRTNKAASAKTVSVEFRKKRTYVKRSVVAEEEQSRIDKENAEREKIRAEEEAALKEQEEARAAAEAAKRAKEEEEARAKAEAEARAAEEERRVAEEAKKAAEEEAARQAEIAAAEAAQQQPQEAAPAPATDSKRGKQVRDKDKEDGKSTRYGRKELHVATEKSGRRRKKTDGPKSCRYDHK